MEERFKETPWMDWMKANIGQKEIPGKDGNNPFIIDLFNYTSLKGHELSKLDETAWCAALANAALEKTGFLGTNSAAAASFEECGSAMSVLRYGAIIVLKRNINKRHVTFFVDYKDDSHIICLGGNQRDSLCESVFKIEDIVKIRWPLKKNQKTIP